MFASSMAKVNRAHSAGSSWVICSVSASNDTSCLTLTPCICYGVLTAPEQEAVLCTASCLMVVVGLHTVPSCVDPAADYPGFLVLAC